jgi:uridine kinase
MTIKIIGITGGSGAGKSTLCNALKNKYPDKIELIQLDDYFKPRVERPMVGNIVNSDHPDSLYLDKLAKDLANLSNGESVVINTKNEFINPDFETTKEKIPFEFKPKPIILVEGYLLLHDEKIRKLLTTSIFLDVKHDVRWARRVHLGNKNKEYEEKVIIPMHNQFIEPTKKYAEYIIDISNLNQKQVFEKIEKIIFS